MLSRTQAEKLLEALSGNAPGVFLSFELIRRLGGLDAAAFVSQAAWLSKNASDEDGWFFLEQEGDGVATTGIYGLLGSWESGLGISKSRQNAIRESMVAKGMLVEMPSETAEKRRGSTPRGNLETAFMFVQRRGTPGRLHYRLSSAKYLDWLAQGYTPETAGDETEPKGAKSRKRGQKSAESDRGVQPIDSAHKDKIQLTESSISNLRKARNSTYVYKKELVDRNEESFLHAVRAEKNGLDEQPKAPRSQTGKTKKIVAGVETWDEEDRAEVRSLIQRHGRTVVEGVAAKMKTAGGRALPSYVKQHLDGACNATNHRTPAEQFSTNGGLSEADIQAAIKDNIRYYRQLGVAI